MNWTAKYVGIPFLNHGRDFKGLDCWGLVRLVLREEKGIVVPEYGEIDATNLLQIAGIIKHEQGSGIWTVFAEPEPFDVAVMFRRHEPVHVGVMVTKDQVLHVEEKISAALVPMKHHTMAFRRPSFHRHRELLNVRSQNLSSLSQTV